MPTRLSRSLALIATLLVVLPLGVLIAPRPASAAASMSVSAAAAVTVGDSLTVSINVNTGGQSANAFDATFSYSTELFEGVRGTYSGSICTLPISQPDPSSGQATISCGRPGGYNGSGLVMTVILKALKAGNGTLGLSSCQVLANDGIGSDITGGCSGRSVELVDAPVVIVSTTPTPGASAVIIKPTKTPKPSTTPKGTPTPTPGGTAKPADSAQSATPTPVIEAPAATLLPPSTATPTPESEESGPQTEKRSIGQAIKDIINSLKQFGDLKGNSSGAVAVLLLFFPLIGLLFAACFFIYRIYMLEGRRRRTMDRLFELELAELASLEGKLDLLAEKGQKGREEFKGEFKATKENILRQIKPDYGKPVDEPKKEAAAPSEEKPAEAPKA